MQHSKFFGGSCRQQNSSDVIHNQFKKARNTLTDAKDDETTAKEELMSIRATLYSLLPNGGGDVDSRTVCTALELVPTTSKTVTRWYRRILDLSSNWWVPLSLRLVLGLIRVHKPIAELLDRVVLSASNH